MRHPQLAELSVFDQPYLQSEWNVVFGERFHEQHRVLNVHLSIGGAVHQQELFVLDLEDVLHEIALVVVQVAVFGPGQAHVAFDEERQVVAPRGDRRDGDRAVEHRVLATDQRSHQVAAEAFAEDAESFLVDVG